LWSIHPPVPRGSFPQIWRIFSIYPVRYSDVSASADISGDRERKALEGRLNYSYHNIFYHCSQGRVFDLPPRVLLSSKPHHSEELENKHMKDDII
jgi:hypothetical protein